MEVIDDRITAVRFRNMRNGVIETVRPEIVINAAGAWVDDIATLAGCRVPLSIDMGSMVVLNGRLGIQLTQPFTTTFQWRYTRPERFRDHNWNDVQERVVNELSRRP